MKIDDKITVSARMSQRLIAIAGMLGEPDNMAIRADDGHLKYDSEPGNMVAADVGCDHGYVSIFLVQSGIAKRAIAMDVRKGPLAGAQRNIRDYGLEYAIETRLSDGLKGLSEGETGGLVIAGMGGKLMIRILQEGDPVRLGIRKAILQPQSDIDEFRAYIRNSGFHILDEKIIYDEGKYYFPMKVSFEKNAVTTDDSGKEYDYLQEAMGALISGSGCDENSALAVCNRFGEFNIHRKEKLLKDYCEHGKKVTESILTELSGSGHTERVNHLQKELNELNYVLSLL